MSTYKKRPVYSLLFFVFVGFVVAISLWLYMGQFIGSFAGKDDVVVSSTSQTLQVKKGENASAAITIKSGSRLSAFHLVFQPTEEVGLVFKPAQIDGKTAPFIQLLASTSSDVSYGVLADKEQSPKEVRVPFDVICMKSGTHIVNFDSSSSDFFGADATKELTVKNRFSLQVSCPASLRALSNESVSPNMTLSFDPVNVAAKVGEEIKSTLLLTPESLQAGIGAFDISLAFDKTHFESAEFGNLYDPTKPAADQVIEDASEKVAKREEKKIEVDQGTGRLFYTIHVSDGELPKKLAIPITLKTKSKGSGSITVTASHASGTVSGELYSITPGTVSYDVLDPNGKEAIGNISMKLQFHGITSKPEKPRQLNVRVTLAEGPESMDAAKVITFTPDDQGFFNAAFPFAFVPGGNYKVKVKGPQHRGTTVCEIKPIEGTSEDEKGAYQCNKGTIELKEGENSLDFSGIVMLAGDLPPQDGTINSGDLITCKNLFNKSDQESINTCDIDQNGLVNAAFDYRHIIKSLDKKKDDL